MYVSRRIWRESRMSAALIAETSARAIASSLVSAGSIMENGAGSTYILRPPNCDNVHQSSHRHLLRNITLFQEKAEFGPMMTDMPARTQAATMAYILSVSEPHTMRDGASRLCWLSAVSA